MVAAVEPVDVLAAPEDEVPLEPLAAVPPVLVLEAELEVALDDEPE